MNPIDYLKINMIVTSTNLPGIVIIEPVVHEDTRGFFLESFHTERYRDLAGIEEPFVQENHSRSSYGVLRGLHFQVNRPQGKLVRITRGEAFDVAVDINPESPHYCQYVGVHLSEDNKRQVYIPPGYAHGYLVLSEFADFEYKCTDYYDPSGESGIIWNDPDIGIQWPIKNPKLSAKDSLLPRLNEKRQ